MSLLIRLSLTVFAAIVALFVAIAVLKLVIALAILGAGVAAVIFALHFCRALYRRLAARAEQPLMLN